MSCNSLPLVLQFILPNLNHSILETTRQFSFLCKCFGIDFCKVLIWLLFLCWIKSGCKSNRNVIGNNQLVNPKNQILHHICFIKHYFYFESCFQTNNSAFFLLIFLNEAHLFLLDRWFCLHFNFDPLLCSFCYC